MKSYSLWIDKKKQAKIINKEFIYKKNSNTVLVKTIFSGISKGTEKLVSTKLIKKNQFKLMRAPFQDGSFNLPIKYGYINVGKIINGPKKLINRNIFSLFPHQTLFEIPIKNINLLPNKNIKKYILIANMETAINIFWDSQSNKNDKILIFGLGSVGLLTAYFFKLQNYKKVYVYDTNYYKKKYAKLLGLKFINIKQAKDFNVIINTTSNYKILEKSMSLLEDEGKIIEASWYGSKKGFLSLGDYFHSKRLKLISSQVSQIPKHMKNKYDYKKRLKLAINSLKDKKLEKLITSESNFFNLESDYFKILNDNNTIMHLIKY